VEGRLQGRCDEVILSCGIELEQSRARSNMREPKGITDRSGYDGKALGG